MKKLLLITGPNGVGKSTTAECILEACMRCAYVDADWCRAINPFPLTPATRETVIANIHALLLNYLLCSDIETIVFPYALHGGRQDMLDTVLSRLRTAVPAFSLVTVVVTCSLEENIRRAQQDGRSPERIARGGGRLPHLRRHRMCCTRCFC